MKDKLFIPLIFLTLLILLDQVTKAWAVANLATVCNRGIAFGMWQGLGNGLIAALVLATILVIFASEVQSRRATPGVGNNTGWFTFEASAVSLSTLSSRPKGSAESVRSSWSTPGVGSRRHLGNTPGVLLPWRFWGLLLVLSGGASNIIDRLMRGCVVDFINFAFLPRLTWPPLPDLLTSSLTRWPAFNLADAAIVVGVGMILTDFLSFLHDRDKATPSR